MQNKMKRPAFTLSEAMVGLLIISCTGMAAMRFTSSFLKNKYERDIQISAVVQNMNMAEALRAEVKTLPQLYEFSKDKDIKIWAVGIGEIELSQTGEYTVTNSESFSFPKQLEAKAPRLFKIEIGGNVPNSKITAVVRIN